jgi:hypothetical protein
MQEVTEITTLIQDWLLPVAITLVALSALLLVKSLLLLRANRKAPHQGLQVFLKTLGLPLTLCILVVTLFLFSTLVHNFGLDSEGLQATNTNIARLLLIAALVLFVDRLTVGLLASYSTRSELLRNSHSVARGMVHILVFGIGLLVLLGTLGVSIPPLWRPWGITSPGRRPGPAANPGEFLFRPPADLRQTDQGGRLHRTGFRRAGLRGKNRTALHVDQNATQQLSDHAQQQAVRHQTDQLVRPAKAAVGTGGCRCALRLRS